MSLSRTSVFKALALATILFACTAKAQVVYTDIEPDIHLTGWEAHQLNLGTQQSTVLYIWKHPNEVVVNSMAASIQVLYSGDHPAALEDGAMISSSGDWRQPNYAKLNHEGSTGNWINVEDRFLAVRYRESGDWYYAWVRMDIDAAPSYFTLKDYAEEQTANASIDAGSVTADVEASEISDAWTINGREIIAKSDCEVRVASVSGAAILKESLDAGESLTIEAPPGSYLISVQNNKMSEVVKVVLR